MKHSADDNFEFDVNSRKVSKLVENTVGKGEISHNEQFLLHPQCFQKACFPWVSKGVIVWEWVKLHNCEVCAERALHQTSDTTPSQLENIDVGEHFRCARNQSKGYGGKHLGKNF